MEFKAVGEAAQTIAQEIIAKMNEPPESASWPVIEQIAVLMMMDGRAVREERHIIINKLIDQVQDKPTWSDFAKLVIRGWCEKKPGARWHTLTAVGAGEAKRLLRYLCREFNLHRPCSADGGARYEVRYSCTCGHQIYVRKGRATESNAMSRFCSHLQRIDYRAEEAGMTREEVAQRRLHEEIAAPSMAPEQAEEREDA